MDETVEVNFWAGLGGRNNRQAQLSSWAQDGVCQTNEVGTRLRRTLETLEHATRRATGRGITAGLLRGKVSVEDEAAETVSRLSVGRARRGDDVNEHSGYAARLLAVDSSRGGIRELLPLLGLGTQILCLLGIAIDLSCFCLSGEVIHLGLELSHAGLGLRIRPAPL